ncbi:hypothetical protein [Winogradskya humida]|uniref:Uncharacterized protein n=1 Tax=Winogradskya humida TaxID=113566 RepID=A0ABQ3ZNY3_9ACTN|nr:hypothetical protein [Actinoplanes humidus]GIE19897.1 hypothetical protein Ahu01nite_029990 [Actinoplanes humidus]
MTTTDDLLRSIEELAGTASDGAGMTERVQAGARRVRRRRRIGAAAAVACLVLIGALVPAAVVRLRADDPLPASSTPTRAPGQLTVRGAAGSPYTWNRGTDGALQWMTPFRKGGDEGAEVRVYDPGTYDARKLKKGERVTVGDHQAYWGTASVDVHLSGGGNWAGTKEGVHLVPTIGWQDESGVWVTVIDAEPSQPRHQPVKDLLLDVATYVEIGPAEDILVPVHFRTIPGNRKITFADVDELPNTSGTYQADLGFGGDRTPTVDLYRPSYMSIDTPLQIKVMTLGAGWNEMTYDPVNTTIAGRPARYFEGEAQSVMVPKGGSSLLVEVGTCGILVQVSDRKAIPRSALDTMFKGATFDRCDSLTTWTRLAP